MSGLGATLWYQGMPRHDLADGVELLHDGRVDLRVVVATPEVDDAPRLFRTEDLDERDVL